MPMSDEEKQRIAEVLRTKTLEAIDLAEKLALVLGPVNPAMAAMALRVAAEYAEFKLRKDAGAQVFMGYELLRDEVVKAASRATDSQLGTVRS